MFLVGLSQGPLHHYWYSYLDRLLPSKSLRTVGLKILADQLVAAPFFAITFFYGMGVLQGKNLSECWGEFTHKFPAVYLVSTLVQLLVVIQSINNLFCSFTTDSLTGASGLRRSM